MGSSPTRGTIYAGIAQRFSALVFQTKDASSILVTCSINADVAQLVRASPCQGEDRRFEPDYPLNYMLIVMLRVASFNGRTLAYPA